jgi:hypothetical protein
MRVRLAWRDGAGEDDAPPVPVFEPAGNGA